MFITASAKLEFFFAPVIADALFRIALSNGQFWYTTFLINRRKKESYAWAPRTFSSSLLVWLVVVRRLLTRSEEVGADALSIPYHYLQWRLVPLPRLAMNPPFHVNRAPEGLQPPHRQRILRARGCRSLTIPSMDVVTMFWLLTSCPQPGQNLS